MNKDVLYFTELIYSAASRPQAWFDFCRALSKRFDGAYIAMHGHDETTGNTLGFLNTTYSADFLKQYKAYYSALNPWMLQAAKTPVGQVQASETILSHEDLTRTEWYNDWIRPQEDIATGAGVTLSRSKERFFRLSCNIRFRDRDRHQDDLVQLLTLLAPHMRRSLEMAQALANIPLNTDIQAALNLAASPIFVLDRECTVLFFNSSAATFLKSDGSVSLSRSSKFKFRDTYALLRLQTIVEELLTSNYMAAITAPNLRFQSPSGQLGARVSLFNSCGTRTLGFLDVAYREAPVIILRILPEDNSGELLRFKLRSEYLLSSAEIDLCVFLSEGHTMQDYAHHRGISLNTVKTQLKNVYLKLDVSRQSEMMAVVSTIS